MIEQPLDRRDVDRHQPDRLAAHWRDPRARWLTVAPNGAFGAEMVGEPIADDESVGGAVFLGVTSSGPWFARRGEVAGGITIREAGALSAEHRELAMAATAILAWHDTEPRCERCHAPTVSVDGGFSRACRECGQLIFPRTDPAMIVALVDPDDRLLLAHQEVWPPGRASILAGFVEAGESAEAAVVREVAEESQLRVSALRFLTSQAWPFPRSLMLAYVARAHGEPVVDGVELSWARWFTREQYEAELAAGSLLPPGGGSVASRLINWWRRGDLLVPEEGQLPEG